MSRFFLQQVEFLSKRALPIFMRECVVPKARKCWETKKERKCTQGGDPAASKSFLEIKIWCELIIISLSSTDLLPQDFRVCIWGLGLRVIKFPSATTKIIRTAVQHGSSYQLWNGKRPRGWPLVLVGEKTVKLCLSVLLWVEVTSKWYHPYFLSSGLWAISVCSWTTFLERLFPQTLEAPRQIFAAHFVSMGQQKGCLRMAQILMHLPKAAWCLCQH